MQAVCQEGIGGCAIGVGNDTDVEPDDGAIVQAGELDVIFAYVPRLTPNLTSNQRVRVRVYEAGSMERGWGGDTKGEKGEIAKKKGEKGGCG